MKKLKLLTVLFCALLVKSVMANMPAKGIYLTQDDYLNHKLTYSANATKIKVDGILFQTDKITVVVDGKKTVLAKKDVFGYRLQNEDYRLYNNEGYKIVNTDDFYIFTHPKLVPSGKGSKQIVAYYFSPKIDGAIQPLTVSNIKVAYAENTKFRFMVDGQFKADEELAAYDPTIKAYKLKYVYDECTK